MRRPNVEALSGCVRVSVTGAVTALCLAALISCGDDEGGVERECPADAIERDGVRYGRDPEHDCDFVDENGVVIEPSQLNSEHQRRVVVFAFGRDFLIDHFTDMEAVEVAVRPDPRRDRFVAAVLEAATQVEKPLRPALSRRALPSVVADGSRVVLDWDRRAASEELGIWSTSTGSTGLNLILGMVFENDPAVDIIEMRMDGSCRAFTEAMQGAGCQTFTREHWLQFRGE